MNRATNRRTMGRTAEIRALQYEEIPESREALKTASLRYHYIDLMDGRTQRAIWGRFLFFDRKGNLLPDEEMLS